MEKTEPTLVIGKAECNLYPAHSQCLKRINRGDCPDKESHGCSSKQRKHATDSGFQVIQQAHFMRALEEGKHLEPFPGETDRTDAVREILERSPSFKPCP